MLPGWRDIGNIVEITGFPPPLPQRRGHGVQGAGMAGIAGLVTRAGIAVAVYIQ
jgi:hypothetical protein